MELNRKQKALIELIQQHSYKIVDDDSYVLNKTALLCAIAVCESSLGRHNRPRHEASYDVGGRYYKKSKTVRELVQKYGPNAACSWSSFQIMYITAYELGYRGNPEYLTDDTVAINYIIKFINKRIISKDPSSIGHIFDAYNSGNFKDKIIPQVYIDKGMRHYAELCRTYPIEIKKEAVPEEQPLPDNDIAVETIKEKVKEDIAIFKDQGCIAPDKTLFDKFLDVWKNLFGHHK